MRGGGDEEIDRILDSIPGAVVRVANDGTITSANGDARRILGLQFDAQHERFITPFDMFTEDGVSWSFQSLVSTESARPRPQTVGIRQADGAIVWTMCRALPFRDGTGNFSGVTATIVDVTERKRTVDDLRRNETKWRLLAEHVPDFVIVVNPDGGLVSINHVFPELDEERVLHSTIWDFVPPDVVEQYRATLDRVVATRQRTRFETRGYGANGTIAWYETILVPLIEEGSPDRVLVVARDISDRKRAEDAVQAIEHNWRALVESLPEDVIIVDRERIILSTNRGGEYPAVSPIGEKADAYIDATVLESWLQHFTTAIETGLPVRLETRGWSGAGKMAWYESILVPLKERGVVERVMIVARDISERRAMLSTLAEKERLASIGMVASSVAHEIMNPLTYVLASLELALGSSALLEESERLTAIVEAREGARRMQQIVGDLRSLGRTGGEELFYVDARRVLESALRLSSHEVGRAARIILDLHEIPGVLASESQLCQVFINLLVNAAQSVSNRAPADREIKVRTRHDEAGGLVAIEFADTGIGIPAEHITHIFEPFYTTKTSGTGLGLSISRDIVKRMGGCIAVESASGQGSTFTVSLPTTRANGANGTRRNGTNGSG